MQETAQASSIHTVSQTCIPRVRKRALYVPASRPRNDCTDAKLAVRATTMRAQWLHCTCMPPIRRTEPNLSKSTKHFTSYANLKHSCYTHPPYMPRRPQPSTSTGRQPPCSNMHSTHAPNHPRCRVQLGESYLADRPCASTATAPVPAQPPPPLALQHTLPPERRSPSTQTARACPRPQSPSSLHLALPPPPPPHATPAPAPCGTRCCSPPAITKSAAGVLQAAASRPTAAAAAAATVPAPFLLLPPAAAPTPTPVPKSSATSGRRADISPLRRSRTVPAAAARPRARPCPKVQRHLGPLQPQHDALAAVRPDAGHQLRRNRKR